MNKTMIPIHWYVNSRGVLIFLCTGHKSKLTLKNLITLRIVLMQNLFELKNKSSIYQYEFNGGVAQLVRARDS